MIPRHLFPITFPHTAHASLLCTLRMLGLFIPDPINTQSPWTSGDQLEVCACVSLFFTGTSALELLRKRQFLFFKFLVLHFKYFGVFELKDRELLFEAAEILVSGSSHLANFGGSWEWLASAVTGSLISDS